MPNATFSSVFKQCAFMAFILIHSFVMSPTINKDLNKVKNQTFPRCLKITQKSLIFVHYITSLLLSLNSHLIITFPYCHYIPLQSLHSHLIITLPTYHYIRPTLSLHSLLILTISTLLMTKYLFFCGQFSLHNLTILPISHDIINVMKK